MLSAQHRHVEASAQNITKPKIDDLHGDTLLFTSLRHDEASVAELGALPCRARIIRNPITLARKTKPIKVHLVVLVLIVKQHNTVTSRCHAIKHESGRAALDCAQPMTDGPGIVVRKTFLLIKERGGNGPFVISNARHCNDKANFGRRRVLLLGRSS